MYCSKCGFNAENNSTYCANCGAKLSEDNTQLTSTPKKQTALKTDRKTKNSILITFFSLAGLIVILLILALIFALTAKDGANTPEKAAEIYFEATFKKDSDRLMSVMSPYAKNEIMDNSNGNPIDDRHLKAYLDKQMKYSFSDVKLLDVECTVIKNYNYDELNSIRNKYYRNYGKGTESYGTITDFVSLDVVVTVLYNGDVKTNTSSIQACCIDDRWYILSF